MKLSRQVASCREKPMFHQHGIHVLLFKANLLNSSLIYSFEKEQMALPKPTHTLETLTTCWQEQEGNPVKFLLPKQQGMLKWRFSDLWPQENFPNPSREVLLQNHPPQRENLGPRDKLTCPRQLTGNSNLVFRDSKAQYNVWHSIFPFAVPYVEQAIFQNCVNCLRINHFWPFPAPVSHILAILYQA